MIRCPAVAAREVRMGEEADERRRASSAGRVDSSSPHRAPDRSLGVPEAYEC